MSDLEDRNYTENTYGTDNSAPAGEYTDPAAEPQEPSRAYTDAGYIPASEAPHTPRQFSGVRPDTVTYAYTNRPQNGKPPKRDRNGRGWLIAVLCALFLLLGVGGGYAIFHHLNTGETAAGEERTERIAPKAAEEDEDDDDDDRDEDELVADEKETETAVVVPTLRTEDIDPDALAANEIYDEAIESVVGISSEISYYNIWGQQVSGAVSGTGFVISEDGYILTNHHVIEDAWEGGYDIQVTFADGTSYTATVVGAEEDNDIAVLKIDADGLTAVRLGNSDNLVVGSTIYTVGHPLGELSYTMTEGIISAKDREITTSTSTTINMFQIDAAVNSGNSGGPVYNAAGQVIGVVTAKYSDTGVEGLGFAIPIDDAVSIANELMTNGYVSGKAYLGLYYDRNYDSVVQRYYSMPSGVYVSSVVEGSCAETAGIQENDVITKLDDTEITSSDDLIQAIKTYRAGDSAVITVYRDGEYEELPIVFDEEPHTDNSGSSIDSGSSQQQQQNNGYPFSYGYGFWN